MRQRLREHVEKSTLERLLNRILLEIERLRVSKANSLSSDEVSTTIDTVLELPEIPTTPGTYKKVFWTSAGAGNGDDQMWEVYYGQTEYTPCQYSTLLSGVPL